jgi:hypothetical protein
MPVRDHYHRYRYGAGACRWRDLPHAGLVVQSRAAAYVGPRHWHRGRSRKPLIARRDGQPPHGLPGGHRDLPNPVPQSDMITGLRSAAGIRYI